MTKNRQAALAYQNDPKLFAEKRLGIKTLVWQGHLDVLDAMAKNDKVAVASGHCFAKGTEILMFNGSVKKVENVEVGDQIMGDDSTSRKILKLSRGEEQMYRITYYDGTEYVHNESHILCLRGMEDRGDMVKDKVVEISIRDFLKLSIRKQRRYAGFRVGVEYETRELPISPYMLGVWIGDGCKTTADIASIDEEIIEEVKKYAESIGCCLTRSSNGRNVHISKQGGKTNAFLSQLRELGLYDNKHIPDNYLYGSRSQRLELLAGLIDTDGSRHSQSGGYDFVQKRKHISEQVVTLARSLGVYAQMVPKYVSSSFADGSHTEGIYWRVYIGAGLNDLPCRLPRKKPLEISGNRNLNNTGIRSVEALGVGDYFGFEIDGNQRFLGADFMVLHNSMGKDFLSGVIAQWFLYCFPPAVVITTAPTSRQVEKIIWGEISKYWNSDLGGQLLTQEIKLAPDWYAIGFTTKDTKQLTGKFQGFKGKNILVIVTEAQAVEASIYDQIEGVMTAENSKLYLAGNPLISEGGFFKAFADPSFKTFNFSCYDSPNYKAGKEVVPGMVGRKWVDDKEKKWGKGTPLFEARVEGRFPKISTNSLISLSDCQKSIECEKPVKGVKVMGIDVARFGDDMIEYTIFDGGVQTLIESEGKKRVTQTSGKAFNLLTTHKPTHIVVDAGAMGAGLVDILWEEKDKIRKDTGCKYDVYEFNFGSRPDSTVFADKGTEAYFEACKAIEDGRVKLLDDHDLHSQLSSRRYDFLSRTGKMKLEEKAKHKSRAGSSPDKADAAVMALYLSLEESNEIEDGEQKDYSYLEAQTDPDTGYVNKQETYVEVE